MDSHRCSHGQPFGYCGRAACQRWQLEAHAPLLLNRPAPRAGEGRDVRARDPDTVPPGVRPGDDVASPW